jgi:glycopeptide antibiotics resistance protein
MRSLPQSPRATRSNADWVLRLLLNASVAVILLVTLFPYGFFGEPSLFHPDDEELGGRTFVLRFGEPFQALDVPANVALFLPLGFAVGGLLGLGGRAGGRALGILVVAGAALSLTVELMQLRLPSRDPSFLDVASNTVGTFLGGLIYRLVGARVIARGSGWNLHRPRRPSAVLLAAIYMGFALAAFFLPFRLDRVTQLGNWADFFPLVVGDERTGDRPWQGSIAQIEMADRALAPEEVRRLHRAGSLSVAGIPALVSYDLRAGDYSDRARNLPSLEWKPGEEPPGSGKSGGAHFDGASRLQTRGPARALTDRVRETNEFTLSIHGATASAEQDGPARIVTQSWDIGHRNFTLGQAGMDLNFRLRMPLTGENGLYPEFYAPGVFSTSAPQHLVITYEAAQLRLFVNGEETPYGLRYRASHGIRILAYLMPLDPRLAREYEMLFYLATFLPLGGLAALWIAGEPRRRTDWWVGILSALLASAVFETIQARFYGVSVNLQNLLIAALLAAAVPLVVLFARRLSPRETAE